MSLQPMSPQQCHLLLVVTQCNRGILLLLMAAAHTYLFNTIMVSKSSCGSSSNGSVRSGSSSRQPVVGGMQPGTAGRQESWNDTSMCSCMGLCWQSTSSSSWISRSFSATLGRGIHAASLEKLLPASVLACCCMRQAPTLHMHAAAHTPQTLNPTPSPKKPSNWMCAHTEYRLVAKKGEGTFSEVLKAQCVKSGKYVAIKCMKNKFDSMDQVNKYTNIINHRRQQQQQ